MRSRTHRHLGSPSGCSPSSNAADVRSEQATRRPKLVTGRENDLKVVECTDAQLTVVFAEQ